MNLDSVLVSSIMSNDVKIEVEEQDIGAVSWFIYQRNNCVSKEMLLHKRIIF